MRDLKDVREMKDLEDVREMATHFRFRYLDEIWGIGSVRPRFNWYAEKSVVDDKGYVQRICEDRSSMWIR